MREVGERVRALRARRGLTRQKLADISGVSLRYLAQWEAGAGNVSLSVLHRVAAALDTPAPALLGGPVDDIAALYSAAPDALRQRVREMLAPPVRARRVALIGLRGAGKTTLGRLLGTSLNWPFVELNREIEALSGLAVNEVIALYGQEGYRRLERQAVDRVVAARDEVVLAAAGWVVTEAETFRFVQAHFHTVWLKAAPHEHMNRVRAQGDERPMAGHPRAMEELNARLRDREALYASAHATVDTSGRGVAESHDALVRTVAALGLA